MRTVSRLRLSYGLYGLVFGIAFATIAFVTIMRQGLIVERESPLDFATTVRTIKTNAAAKGWTVSEMESVHSALLKAGAPDIAAVEVIEMCPSDHACQILRSGKRSCLAMVPASVAVYERNGRVYMATLNRGLIGRFYRHEAFGILKEVRTDERDILQMIAAR